MNKETYTEHGGRSSNPKRTTPQLLEYALGRMQRVRNIRSWLGVGWCRMVERLTLLSQLERRRTNTKIGQGQFACFPLTEKEHYKALVSQLEAVYNLLCASNSKTGEGVTPMIKKCALDLVKARIKWFSLYANSQEFYKEYPELSSNYAFHFFRKKKLDENINTKYNNLTHEQAI